MYEICKQCIREFGVVTRPRAGHVRFGVWFLKGARDCSLLWTIHTGSGANPDTSAWGTRGFLPEGKTAGVLRCMELYFHSACSCSLFRRK
jgi:hypothetical protein